MGLSDDEIAEEELENNKSGFCCSISDGGQSPVDRILMCLRKERRRYLLYYLEEEDGTYIEDAARFIAACEHECDPDDVSAKAREGVKIGLYHVHLPKLADHNIIDYDQRSGAMRFQNPPDGLADFIELCASMELERED